METWHLNLTRSLADVWGLSAEEIAAANAEADAAMAGIAPKPVPFRAATAWTEERVALLRDLWATPMTDWQIANRVGCTPAAVGKKGWRLGLPKRFSNAAKLQFAGAER